MPSGASVTEHEAAIIPSSYLEGTGEERAWSQALCHGHHPAVPRLPVNSGQASRHRLPARAGRGPSPASARRRGDGSAPGCARRPRAGRLRGGPRRAPRACRRDRHDVPLLDTPPRSRDGVPRARARRRAREGRMSSERTYVRSIRTPVGRSRVSPGARAPARRPSGPRASGRGRGVARSGCRGSRSMSRSPGSTSGRCEWP